MTFTRVQPILSLSLHLHYVVRTPSMPCLPPSRIYHVTAAQDLPRYIYHSPRVRVLTLRPRHGQPNTCEDYNFPRKITLECGCWETSERKRSWLDPSWFQAGADLFEGTYALKVDDAVISAGPVRHWGGSQTQISAGSFDWLMGARQHAVTITLQPTSFHESTWIFILVLSS